LFNEQLQNIIDAVKNAGWQIKIVSTDTTRMPIDLIAVSGEHAVKLRIFTWAIVKSGRKGERKINWRYLPFRVHHKGTGDTLKTELRGDAYNVLIGQWNEKGILLFALFDPYIHHEHIESSPIQIKFQTLALARKNGFAYQYKNTGDIALVFYPEYFMQVLLGLYKLAFEGTDKKAIAEKISAILESTIPVVEDEVFPGLEKREKIAALRAIRDPSFRKRVLDAYRWKCAMCGIGLDFVIAAHIVSVGQGGTDETRNGIVLCPNHHKAFDLGLIGFNEDYQIVVNKEQIDALSQQGKSNALRKFLSNLQDELKLPNNQKALPSPQCILKALADRGITNYLRLAKLCLNDL